MSRTHAKKSGGHTGNGEGVWWERKLVGCWPDTVSFGRETMYVFELLCKYFGGERYHIKDIIVMFHQCMHENCLVYVLQLGY